jgi:hypothetical protein
MFNKKNKLKNYIWKNLEDKGLWFKHQKIKKENGYKIHKFVGNVTTLYCIQYVDEGLAHCRVASKDINIKYFLLYENMKSGLLECVSLENQKHPNKDPNNGSICIGEYEGMEVNERCAKLICDRIIHFNIDDWYTIPEEMQIIEPWRLSSNAKHFRL